MKAAVSGDRESSTEAATEAMRADGIDAWLVHDFRGNNPVMARLLADMPKTTRRSFLHLPASGRPRLLVHAIEASQFAALGFPVEVYDGRQTMLEQLRVLLRDGARVAMEYSPEGQLPAVSWVDGGTLELVRGLGVEVVSSADLLQVALARWDESVLERHVDACRHVAEVKELAFELIRRRLAASAAVTEYDVQQLAVAQFQERGLDCDHPPIVGVNAHSSDPHYSPAAHGSSSIAAGDWVLIDLWARYPGEENVFADITWVGFAGQLVPAAQARLFDIVRRGRDLVLAELRDAFDSGRALQGWELDAAARRFFEDESVAQHLLHRTGHSLSPGPSVHGLGANLDDMESRDTRTLMPGTGFTVEPGLYVGDFGVRLEVDVYVDAVSGPRVTTPVQDEIVLLM